MKRTEWLVAGRFARVGTTVVSLFAVLAWVAPCHSAIINTQNAKIRVLMTDGFGATERNYMADGNDPAVGGATLNLNGAGVNSIALGIHPGNTAWNLSTLAAGDGATTTGGMTAGFNPFFFGFFLTENVVLSQFDDADANAKMGAARLRVDFTADFQNNAFAIPAAGVLGVFTNFFSNLPAVGDFAEAMVSLTMSGHGGPNLSVSSLAGGDGNPTPGFFRHENPPKPGFFTTDISNSVAFPGVDANALVTLQGHIDVQVDPGSVTLVDINPNPLPEPTTLAMLLAMAGVLAGGRWRRA